MKAKICNIIRKHWHVKLMSLLILLFLAFMPIIINWLYGFEAPYKSFRTPSEWTIFWGTYISGIASVVMIFLTWRTLQHQIKQTAPIIGIRFIKIGDKDFNIVISNFGITIGTDIRIHTTLGDFKGEIYIQGLFPHETITKPFLRQSVNESSNICVLCGEYTNGDKYNKCINYWLSNEIEVKYSCSNCAEETIKCKIPLDNDETFSSISN